MPGMPDGLSSPDSHSHIYLQRWEGGGGVRRGGRGGGRREGGGREGGWGGEGGGAHPDCKT